ncbi:MAG: hypothetical protein ACYCSS_07400 [Sulfuriferula sp.]
MLLTFIEVNDMRGRKWTPEQKAEQAAKIRSWKPWTRSTGARTPEGKAIISQNVRRGQVKRQAAIEAARAQIEALQASVRKLRTRGADVAALLK